MNCPTCNQPMPVIATHPGGCQCHPCKSIRTAKRIEIEKQLETIVENGSDHEPIEEQEQADPEQNSDRTIPVSQEQPPQNQRKLIAHL